MAFQHLTNALTWHTRKLKPRYKDVAFSNPKQEEQSPHESLQHIKDLPNAQIQRKQEPSPKKTSLASFHTLKDSCITPVYEYKCRHLIKGLTYTRLGGMLMALLSRIKGPPPKIYFYLIYYLHVYISLYILYIYSKFKIKFDFYEIYVEVPNSRTFMRYFRFYLYN